MNLKNISDKIYVLNLKEREDRRKHILAELEKVDVDEYELIYSVNGNELNINSRVKKGNLGLVKTYLNIFDSINNEEENNFLFIEDDCVFVEDFNKKLSEYINSLPDDWDMLYFGANHNYHVGGKTELVNEKVIKLNNSYSSHCVLLKKHVLKELINTIKNMDIELDVALSKLQKKYNAYSSKEKLTTQLPGFSDIENRVVDYDWLIK
jgi:GR25 family glycosyltransferase involved in LPS biosynthesis